MGAFKMAVCNIENLDISTISPNEIFILDANILSYLYSGYVLDQQKALKASKYSNFISGLLSNGNNISTSAAYVQEVLNYIEKTEYNLYKKRSPTNQLNRKQFRNNTVFRSIVEKKTNNVYSAICQNCYNVYDINISKQTIDGFVNNFGHHVYDPIDYIVAEDLSVNNRLNIITDDRDYRSDSRLQVYTVI